MGSRIFSVIVCTYNRSELLGNCLESLVGQDVDQGLYEVVIINNNSTDETVSVVDKFIEKFPNVRLVYEQKQGLSHARNRGWREAKGRYVAYIDDDATAHNNWIYEMHQFTVRHPEIQAFGGPYFPFSFVEIPDWMPDGFGKNYKGEEERPVDIGREWISGSNMVFKKKILNNIGGFATDLGMTGKKVAYGEETVLFRKISSLKHSVYYVPKMQVDHLVAEYKMNFKWILKSYYAHGRCGARVTLNERSMGAHFVDTWKTLRRFFVTLHKVNKNLTKKELLQLLMPVSFQFGSVIEKVMISLKFEYVEQKEK
ncbi:MAG: glycosyltransferase family 2 protein [Candidatus Electrothrix sp. ATG2]|nr:glycosyltransferase family 2 protein [Candidatus Electrothrix sp. ATG2]